MSTIKLEEQYTCSDDCNQAGCPGHTAEIEYQSVTDSYKFTGRGGIRYFERNELEAFIKLLKELQDIRADSIQITELMV